MGCATRSNAGRTTFIRPWSKPCPNARRQRTYGKNRGPHGGVAALEDQPEPPRRRDNVALWRSWGAVAAAAAIALAVYVVLDSGRWMGGPTVDVVAVLNDANAQPAWAVHLNNETQRLRIQALREQTLAPDKSFELWLLPGANQAPIPLGLIPASGATELDLNADLLARLPAGQALAVSLEPAGGSPTGLPTGPVLYQGALIPPSA
ncbi:MAG: anti-sigma factor [Gammaproteobacteria bacterium]